MPTSHRKICFVTGTRAEFGLMQSTLEAIDSHPALELQIVVTGMHLDRTRGQSRRRIELSGWKFDHVVPWKPARTPRDRAVQTGLAAARLAEVFGRLKADVVLVVGDRVEAFAAASAGHLCDLPVAHVHGGDRALGQADDSLRHAITKLAHVHFAATRASAGRIIRLGEDAWRVRRVGAPGIDGIRAAAASMRAIRQALPGVSPQGFALLVLHPIEPHDGREFRRARMVLQSTLRSAIDQVVIIHPNNDPGGAGIVRCWNSCNQPRALIVKDLARGIFLGLLREAAFLIGNSSAGIIEAASFGTPVIDIGPRQLGREHGPNVVHCPFDSPAISRAIERTLRKGRYRPKNVYGGAGTGRRIAQTLASIRIDDNLIRKLIAY